LFLAGFAVAMGIARQESKGATQLQIGKTFLLRGAEIFGIAVAFRIEQWAEGWGWSPWTDMLRVDVLNMIGLSLAMAGIVPLIARALWPRVTLALSIAAGFTLLAPWMWYSAPLGGLPWWIASYLHGGHITREPRGWYF